MCFAGSNFFRGSRLDFFRIILSRPWIDESKCDRQIWIEIDVSSSRSVKLIAGLENPTERQDLGANKLMHNPKNVLLMSGKRIKRLNYSAETVQSPRMQSYYS